MNVQKGKNVTIKNNVCIGDNVVLEDNVYIDSNVIIRDNVHIKKNTYVGSNSILGEYQVDFYRNYVNSIHPLIIGENSIIRSGTTIYGDTQIGDNFSTGHSVTIREFADIGNHVSIGTLSDIQGKCKIGNYSRLHSNVHIGQESVIEDFVWIFPYVVLTNDPTPPSNEMLGVHIHSYAVVATGSIILPGIDIAEDSLVAAGAIVTKNVEKYNVVAGNPAKIIGDIRKIRNKITGESVYPWRERFSRGMPWEECGYEKWKANLDLHNEKNR